MSVGQQRHGSSSRVLIARGVMSFLSRVWVAATAPPWFNWWCKRPPRLAEVRGFEPRWKGDPGVLNASRDENHGHEPRGDVITPLRPRAAQDARGLGL